MKAELVITPGASGWEVRDAESRLPVSRYRDIEEATEDAHDYLAFHGGGHLIIREGSVVISDIAVRPREPVEPG
jgi:hypothetical protein